MFRLNSADTFVMKAERYPTKEKAQLEVFGKNIAVNAKVNNISKTGACVDWDPAFFKLVKGDLLRMTVELKSLNKAHHLSAQVIWSIGNRGGIQFLNSDELFKKMLIR